MSREIDIPDRKGVYILILEVSEECNIHIGKTKIFKIDKGIYIYVGSALHSLRRRLKRYLKFRELKKLHWHIDYLLTQCSISNISIIYATLEKYKLSIRPETLLSNLINSLKNTIPIKGFGCTDLRGVKSNLYKINVNNVENVKNIMIIIFDELFKNYHIYIV